MFSVDLQMCPVPWNCLCAHLPLPYKIQKDFHAQRGPRSKCPFSHALQTVFILPVSIYSIIFICCVCMWECMWVCVCVCVSMLLYDSWWSEVTKVTWSFCESLLDSHWNWCFDLWHSNCVCVCVCLGVFTHYMVHGHGGQKKFVGVTSSF